MQHVRRGAAFVELAICLPILLLIALGSMEAANLIFLRQALVQSAYEAAKVASKTGDETLARNAAMDVADGRQIKQLSFAFSPTNLKATNRGEKITVTISAPGDSNSVIPFGPFTGKTVAVSAVMVRE